MHNKELSVYPKMARTCFVHFDICPVQKDNEKKDIVAMNSINKK